MADFPFLHPALLGVAVAGGIAWSALAPERLRGLAWAAGAGVAAALLAGLVGWVPWTGRMRLTAYAVCMLAGFAVGWWMTKRRAARVGIPEDHPRLQFGLAAIAGILGARLWYVIEYRREFPDPTADPAAWLTLAADLDRGGAVWFGGLLLATIAMYVHTRRSGVAPIPWADCLAPGVLAGLAVGRIGCWFNGCCYGGGCDLPWAVQHDGHAVHPTQLYEVLVVGILAVLVARVAPGRGAASGWAMLGYAGWRFFNETMRGDYGDKLGQGFSLSPFHLTSAQWFCLPLAAFGVWMVLRSRRPA